MRKKTLPTLLLAIMLANPFTLIACKETPSPNVSVESADTTDGQAPETENLPLVPPSPITPPAEESPEETPPTATPPTVTPPVQPIVEKAEYIRCTGDSVNIRSGAGTNFSVVGNADKGGMYALTGKSGTWYKTYYRGKTAYISTSYATVLSIEKTKNAVEDVIEEGYKLLGVPYVYGAVRLHDGNGKLLAGFSAQRFDCSSLIQYIFYQGAGKLLGVHTRSQVKQGKYVKRSDLERGDCIFFTNEARQYNTGIERVGHVALYLGDGYILHTASDYARIEKISNKRWSFYIEARRFL